MKVPIKETRTKILLLLFLFSDQYFSPVSLNSTIEKIFDLSFNQKTAGVISGLIKERLIEKDENKENSYRLTEKGFKVLVLEFPFFRFLKYSWDGLWRVISYEIPESKRQIRDRLRREMRGWGLGPWHRSFWLTPHPIISHLRDLIYGREEEKYFQAFESTHVFGDINILLEKVWQKSQLEKRYRQLFKKWHEILSSSLSKEEKMKGIVSSYVEVLKIDPGLPSVLLGKNWLGFEAYSIFKEIKTILLS